jgi:antitoxin component YwqK of YwqJK toxin-antitoxin module
MNGFYQYMPEWNEQLSPATIVIMKKRLFFLITILCYGFAGFAQQPRYTQKHFMKAPDTKAFPVLNPKNGKTKSYILTSFTYWDIDDDSTTFVIITDSVFIRIEGQAVNGKREGTFSFYLIDSADHNIRYKVYEQEFKNDLIHGQFKSFALSGGLVKSQTYEAGVEHGLMKEYWLDGKTVTMESMISKTDGVVNEKHFNLDGLVIGDFSYSSGKLNGPSKKYYPSGKIQEYAEFKEDAFHGIRRYYYENGQVWIEQTYKDGKNWSVEGNYTITGVRRNPGTLKDGNGTVIFYDEDGKVRETQTFVNGIFQQ